MRIGMITYLLKLYSLTALDISRRKCDIGNMTRYHCDISESVLPSYRGKTPFCKVLQK